MNTTQYIMICTDLDRTLLPNGTAPETPGARNQFQRLVSRIHGILVYVTGRHLQLVDEAIHDYNISIPEYAVTDVGTRIYTCGNNGWSPMEEWYETIQKTLGNFRMSNLKKELNDIDGLILQEAEKQNRHKLSFYIEPYSKMHRVKLHVSRRLNDLDAPVSATWSYDSVTDKGLLDVLPTTASKLHAVRFLMQRIGIPENRVVFSGDSGNDLDILTSSIRGIIVANADDSVKNEARTQRENPDDLYIATGSLPGFNGNYSAGIIEGILHFYPELRDLSGINPS